MKKIDFILKIYCIIFQKINNNFNKINKLNKYLSL
jgi:hypothetical protein